MQHLARDPAPLTRVYHLMAEGMSFMVTLALRARRVEKWIRGVKRDYLDNVPIKCVGLDCEFTNPREGDQRAAFLQVSVASENLSLTVWFLMEAALPEEERFEALGALNQRRLCAPRQRNLDEVPVIVFDIGENLSHRYQELLQRIFRRAERIAPASYYGKPITPYPNPANHPTKGHSYFRVLWISSTKPNIRVELMIRDSDFYLLGFRKRLAGQEWSIWYCFKDDLGWPSFLEGPGVVQQIWFDGGHQNHVQVGGAVSIEFIFHTLAKWEADQGQDIMIEALQVAVVVLCEALRFFWVEEEIVYRIENNVDPYDLNFTQFGDRPMWKRIGNWRNFSRIAIDAGLNNGVIKTRQVMGRTQFDLVYQVYGFMDMMNGIRVLKRIEGESKLEPRGNQKKPRYGGNVRDPGFIALNEVYPADAAGNWWFQ
ncbi:uncharacterized protein LOC124649834 [Lolium rigidum]|uniref:uncharacterized protein LOC124649834 n=1 Tax=Lolium rigidum TaxID=89674 RepID=UPI001F5CE228|nr:uncharacterized protein LOC124649834 [Lolium rigidum]